MQSARARILRPIAAVALLIPAAAAAQEGPTWNAPAVLDLVSRARDLRRSTVVDSTLRSYRADARGYVYFFFDRPGTEDRNLIKADQLALDLFWAAPNQTKQVIRGRRNEKVLPTDINYHLDHLTVVQDDFGDFIRMGDGDEVAAVLHPVGPLSEEMYDFLLADSLTISYAGGAEQVRVYEIRVRPKDFERSGFIGAIYVDRANAAVVRMSFSFTPSSYVDPYLDYIRISLDNSLWMGRHWLPYRQEVEIRREIPLLDFMAGSIIRSRWEIGDYDFETEVPPSVFTGGRVSTLSPAQQAAFAFERGLFDDIEEEGLVASPSLEEVRTQVRETVEDRTLSGLGPFRFHAAATSDIARYNRAEGLRIGAGASIRPRGDMVLRGSAGYAIGRRRPTGQVTISGGSGGIRPDLELYWDGLGDVGSFPGASTLENTISSVAGHKDYTDPFFRRGATLTLRGASGRGPSLALRWEENRSGTDVVSDDPLTTDFRPVLPITEGYLGAASLRIPFSIAESVTASVTGGIGRMRTRDFGSVFVEALWDGYEPGRSWSGEASLVAGALSGAAPLQETILLGGRWTLPGYGYRSFAGDRFWLLRGEGTLPLHPPYLGVRALGAVGATYLRDQTRPAEWSDVRDSGGVRMSVGAGLSFGWDALRMDLTRGVRGGHWEGLFSVARRFRSWL